MKLTLLGTSHGVPSEIRYGSCYMLEVNDNIYIFDGGAPVIDLLMRKNKDLTKVKAFFNSHFHGDHAYGALNMLALFEWHFKDTDIDAFIPDEKSFNALIGFLKTVDNVELPSERVRVKTYAEGVIFDDGNIKVSSIPVRHNCGPDKKSNAFMIEAEGKKILYTGDMSNTLEDFPAVAFENRFELILSEAAHFSTDALLSVMDKVNTEKFVITHVFPLTKMEEFDNIKDRYKFDVCIAHDNDEYTI